MYQSAESSTHTATTIRPKCIQTAFFAADLLRVRTGKLLRGYLFDTIYQIPTLVDLSPPDCTG